VLFNRAINNTDDHERNFSFMYSAKGYQLAPGQQVNTTPQVLLINPTCPLFLKQKNWAGYLVCLKML
jgi:hypothetical protein